MDRAMACPCTEPSATVCRISRSSVPCNSPDWLSGSLVDIRPEVSPSQVECQGELRIDYREAANSVVYQNSILLSGRKSGLILTVESAKALMFRAVSWLGEPVGWQPGIKSSVRCQSTTSRLSAVPRSKIK